MISGAVTGMTHWSKSANAVMNHEITKNKQLSPLLTPNQTISVGDEPNSIFLDRFNGGNVYVPNFGSSTTYQISLGNVSSIGVFQSGLGSAGGTVYSPNGTALYLYVSDYSNGTVSVFNPSNLNLVKEIALGAAGVSEPNQMTYGEFSGDIYATDSANDSVIIINPSTNTVIGRIPVGIDPVGIANALNSSLIYVANNGSGSVSVISSFNNSVIATIPVGVNPAGIGTNLNGLVYVANEGNNSISVINGFTYQKVATIQVGLKPVGVTYDWEDGLIYVANSESNTVSVIFALNNSVVNTIPVGVSPRFLSYDSFYGAVFVPNWGSNTVSVLYTSNQPLTLGGGPQAYPNSGKAPLQVHFIVSVSGGQPPYSFNWSFGDGTTSTLQDPIHTYYQAGSYTVGVQVMDTSGYGVGEAVNNFVTVYSSSSQINETEFPVIFVSSGLLPNNSWQVTLNGTTISNNVSSSFAQRLVSNQSTITFFVPDGFYSYQVGSAQGTTYPQSGEVTVNGSNSYEVISSVNLGQQYPNQMAYDPTNGLMYISETSSGNVSVLNGTQLVTNIHLNNSIRIGNFTFPSNPYALAYDPADGFVYVTGLNSSADIWVLNGTSLIDTISLLPSGTPLNFSNYIQYATQGIAYDPSNQLVYAARPWGNAITLIDGTRVVGNIGPITAPEQFAYDSSKGEMYVTTQDSGNIVAYSGTQVTSNFTVDSGSYAYIAGMAFNSKLGLMYVLDETSGNIDVLSGSSVFSRIPLPSGASSIAYDPANGFMYLATFSSGGQLEIINGTEQIAIISNGSYVNSLEYANGYMYLANSSSNSISIVSSGAATVQVNFPPANIQTTSSISTSTSSSTSSLSTFTPTMSASTSSNSSAASSPNTNSQAPAPGDLEIAVVAVAGVSIAIGATYAIRKLPKD